MKAKFFKRSALLILPYILMLSFPLVILLSGGELVNIDKIIKAQLNPSNKILLGLAYSNPDRYYKLTSYKLRKPDIIIFGSSAVYQYRSKFFANPDKFYNLSRIGHNIHDLSFILSQIPDSLSPKIMLLGIDEIWFYKDGKSIQDQDIHETGVLRPNTEQILTMWTKVYRDFFKGKMDFHKILGDQKKSEVEKIGLNAILANRGWRNDGSFYEGGYIADPENPKNPYVKDYGHTSFWESIRTLKGWFGEYGTQEPQLSSLKEMEAFLDECKRRNIYVIGFENPFPHELYAALMKRKEGLVNDKPLSLFLKPIFEKRGFGFYDFMDNATIGADAHEFVCDAGHCSEKAALRLIIKIAETNEILAKKVDLNFLKQKLAGAKGYYDVFNFDF